MLYLDTREILPLQRSGKNHLGSIQSSIPAEAGLWEAQ